MMMKIEMIFIHPQIIQEHLVVKIKPTTRQEADFNQVEEEMIKMDTHPKCQLYLNMDTKSFMQGKFM